MSEECTNAPAPRVTEGPAHAVWDPATRYNLLLGLNNALVNETTRDGLFRSLTKNIRKILEYDRLSISIYDVATEKLSWFASAEGITVKQMDETPRSLDMAAIARAVITSRQPLVIPDMARYRHWNTVRMMMDAGLKATMAFPLMARSNVVGSLNFSFKQTPENLDELAGFLSELSGQVALAVDNMLAHSKLVESNAHLQRQKRYLASQADAQYDPAQFFCANQAMQEIMRQVEIVADSDASVLLTGETGTGKDFVARYLHQLSAQRDSLFVKVNCPALTPSLFESELFGHARGAFTGADAARVGRFEMANGGTVFLDEIGELSPQQQAKLLHVLQDRRFERVGDSRPIEVNFRVIAATNMDLKVAMEQKQFRPDLYYRLETVSFHLPPLRERVDEIEPLLRAVARTQSVAMHRPAPVFSAEAIEALKRYAWPGNVRELKNLVNRLVIVCSGQTVTWREIEPFISCPRSRPDEPRTERADPDAALLSMSAAEREHLVKVLTMTRGVVGGSKGAAAVLQVPKSTLQYRLAKHGLDPKHFGR